MKATHETKTLSKAQNSYILKFNTGPVFAAEMKEKTEQLIKQFKLDWWNFTDLSYHLTIATAKGSLEDGAKWIEQRNKELRKKIGPVIDENFKFSIFSYPFDMDITENGWVILKLATLPLPYEKPDSVLRNLHDGFVEQGKNLKLNFNQKHIGEFFTPHISIGKINYIIPKAPPLILKPNQSPETREGLLRAYREANKQAALKNAVAKAKKELEAYKATMLQSFSTVRKLNLYKLQLCYNPKKSDKNAEEQILIEKTLSPRYLGVTKVSMEKDKFLLHFENAIHVMLCAEFLTNFDIIDTTSHSATGVNNFKTKPKKMCNVGKYVGLMLSQSEYRIIAGMIKNCPWDITKIPSNNTSSSVKNNARNFINGYSIQNQNQNQNQNQKQFQNKNTSKKSEADNGVNKNPEAKKTAANRI